MDVDVNAVNNNNGNNNPVPVPVPAPVPAPVQPLVATPAPKKTKQKKKKIQDDDSYDDEKENNKDVHIPKSTSLPNLNNNNPKMNDSTPSILKMLVPSDTEANTINELFSLLRASVINLFVCENERERNTWKSYFPSFLNLFRLLQSGTKRMEFKRSDHFNSNYSSTISTNIDNTIPVDRGLYEDESPGEEVSVDQEDGEGCGKY